MAYYHAPNENMMCGDVEGNIAWLAAALSPRRTDGWYGRLPVPGTGQRARAQIASWDGSYHRSSPEAALHSYWRRALDDAARDPDTDPARRNELSEAALARAVETMRDRQGGDRSQWRWGRIHRSEFPHWLVAAYDLPAVERNGGGGTIAATGATFREIIDFADLDNSRVTSAPGQSAQPGSPFYGNLLPLWANGQFLPLLHSRPAVESCISYRLSLTP